MWQCGSTVRPEAFHCADALDPAFVPTLKGDGGLFSSRSYPWLACCPKIMAKLRYSVRDLLLALTLIAICLAAATWFARTFGTVAITDATAETANRALKGFTTIPSDATNVNVRYTPGASATIKFNLPRTEFLGWCESNKWNVVPDKGGSRFEFVSPRGSGSWCHGKVWFVLFSD
ncbi:hypothetical protein Mal65_54600 [Crateriforma conspicua]|nr:hypothetical protein Mal65_54600 [Crateriforma conspicua]